MITQGKGQQRPVLVDNVFQEQLFLARHVQDSGPKPRPILFDRRECILSAAR